MKKHCFLYFFSRLVSLYFPSLFRWVNGNISKYTLDKDEANVTDILTQLKDQHLVHDTEKRVKKFSLFSSLHLFRQAIPLFAFFSNLFQFFKITYFILFIPSFLRYLFIVYIVFFSCRHNYLVFFSVSEIPNFCITTCFCHIYLVWI